jgi:hypothetical protein
VPYHSLSVARARSIRRRVGECGGLPTLWSAAPPQDPFHCNRTHSIGSALSGPLPKQALTYDSGVLSAVQPSWQASAISTYLKTATGLPDAKLFNATGRGFPDVAAQVANATQTAGASLSRTVSIGGRLVSAARLSRSLYSC